MGIVPPIKIESSHLKKYLFFVWLLYYITLFLFCKPFTAEKHNFYIEKYTSMWYN